MKTEFIHDKKKTKIIAHRGISGIELENTIGSFIAAGNRSYFGIETDVHKTLDGKFVVIHDDETDRISDEKASIENSLYCDLRNIKLGKAENGNIRIDHRIPNLQEYLSICKTYEKTAILEIKNRFAQEDIKAVISIISEYEYLDNTVFISFDFENLVDVRNLLPSATIQFLCTNFDDELISSLKKYNMGIDIDYNALNKESIEKLHNNGITVNCWTVNNKEDAQRLIDYGIDYITSNILE